MSTPVRRFFIAFRYVLPCLAIVAMGVLWVLGLLSSVGAVVYTSLATTAASAFVSLWLIVTGIAKVSIDDSSISFQTYLALKSGVARSTSVSFTDCRVEELQYRKFTKQRFLRFYCATTLIALVGEADWSSVYSELKDSIRQRLTPDRFSSSAP
jgi:hypothetical protein